MICSTLFLKLENSNIQYAVMRNYESLPQSTGGSDLDVLFHPQEIESVKKITQGTFTASGGEVIGVAHTSGFSKYFGFGRSEVDKDWWGVRLDWSFGHTYNGNVDLLDVDAVLAASEIHNGIHVLPSPLANVLGVLKELLHNDEKPARYAVGAADAINSDHKFIKRALRPIGAQAFSILCGICTNELNDEQIRHQSKTLRRALKQHAFRRAPVSFIFRRLSFESSKVRRFISPPGMMIAVLGTDGAGKSTIIDAITPVLDEATHGAFYYRHLRPGLLPALSRIKGLRADGIPVTNPHGAKPAKVIGSWLRIGWLWLDYVAGYWLVVRPKIAKSPAVFLFDRYAHDLYLDPRRFRVGLGRRALKYFPRLVPQPNLIICLHGDPETIASRKDELPVEEVRLQIEALRDMAKTTRGAILVSTDGSIDEARDTVLEAIQAYLRNQGRNR